jgi:RNA polymerase sigma-70 factor (ECF subfamily)
VGDRFQETRWSVVLSAAQGGEASRSALEWLCASYWYPLYAYVRRSGYGVEQARDLTQGFFVSLLERDSLRSVDPKLGKFRAFLLASMNHFLTNERERDAALKRRADNPAFLVDLENVEHRYALEGVGVLGPEAMFESRWARTVLDRALLRLKDEQESKDKGELFRRLSGFLTGDEPSFDRLAADLGMESGTLRVTVHRLRRRLGALLRDEVAHTVADPAEIDDELRSLLEAAGRGR